MNSPFQLNEAMRFLRNTPAVFSAMLSNLPEEWIQHNEGKDTWSAFDIIGHMIHGEKTDWITRMHIILGDGEKTFEPFDRFAQFTESRNKTLVILLEEFAQLREQNLETLSSTSITESDFEKTGIHPVFGNVSLRQLLASWVAHDLTHIHQLSRVLAHRYKDEVGPWKKYMGVMKSFEH